jgi:hypothetical protein
LQAPGLSLRPPAASLQAPGLYLRPSAASLQALGLPLQVPMSLHLLWTTTASVAVPQVMLAAPSWPPIGPAAQPSCSSCCSCVSLSYPDIVHRPAAYLEYSVVVVPLTQGLTCGRQLWLLMFVTLGQQLALLPSHLPRPTALDAATNHLPWLTALAAATADRLPQLTALAAAVDCLPRLTALAAAADRLPWPTALAAAANCLPRPTALVTAADRLPQPTALAAAAYRLPLLLAQVHTQSHSFDCWAQSRQNGATWQTPS